MGNVDHQKGTEIYRNEIKLDKEMLKALERFRKSTAYPKKLFSNYMELRPGMLNFSILGRNCPFSEREEYNKWDNIHHEREFISKEMNKNFPEYDFSLGGKISIDIVQRGYGKEQIALYLRNKYPNKLDKELRTALGSFLFKKDEVFKDGRFDIYYLNS